MSRLQTSPVALRDPRALRVPCAPRAPRAALALATLVALALALALAFVPLAAFADESSESSAPSDSAAIISPDAPAYAEPGSDDDADVDDEAGNNRIDPTQRADNSFIYDTTIESLFAESALYEGSTVQVIGEVVGDLIRANDDVESPREMYWIMLTSTDAENPSSISVLISAEMAKQIDHFGRYGITGTTLQVRGTFHQACADHQGLPDIHATDSSPVARGIERPDPFQLRDFAPGVLAVLIGVVLLGAYYLVRERMR